MILMRLLLLLFALFWFGTNIQGQRDDIKLAKDRKAFAEKSIKEMKEGALVVRLQTNHRKISMLESTLRSDKLKKQQRKRYTAILEGTLKRRNDLNQAIAKMILDSFRFCPVYLMYDTASTSLKNGIRKGIFVNADLQPDTSIQISTQNIFTMNYKKKGGTFPFDVLIIRKLHENLEEPFPYYAQLRESFVNNVNTPGAKRAVARLDRKLARFYANVMLEDE